MSRRFRLIQNGAASVQNGMTIIMPRRVVAAIPVDCPVCPECPPPSGIVFTDITDTSFWDPDTQYGDMPNSDGGGYVWDGSKWVGGYGACDAPILIPNSTTEALLAAGVALRVTCTPVDYFSDSVIIGSNYYHLIATPDLPAFTTGVDIALTLDASNGFTWDSTLAADFVAHGLRVGNESGVCDTTGWDITKIEVGSMP